MHGRLELRPMPGLYHPAYELHAIHDVRTPVEKRGFRRQHVADVLTAVSAILTRAHVMIE